MEKRIDNLPNGAAHFHDGSHGDACRLKGSYSFIRCLATDAAWESQDNAEGRCRTLIPWPPDIEGTAGFYCMACRKLYGPHD
ncbi:MAG TPA: hypothetical protein VNP04_15655 [Alphaproteobacteria bacterium]|nr:hypothetical protein [Alphaproteobacteria bacterium]